MSSESIDEEDVMRRMAAPAIIPLHSDAPAETIARLSVELAAARRKVARMAEALRPFAAMVDSEGRWAIDAARPHGIIPRIDEARAARAALTDVRDDIAIPRERYERMVTALVMGAELVDATFNYALAPMDSHRAERHLERQKQILAAMDAAGKV